MSELAYRLSVQRLLHVSKSLLVVITNNMSEPIAITNSITQDSLLIAVLREAVDVA